MESPYVPPPDNKISVKDSARSRNPAILAQETVVPEFTYDLNDHATQVKKERRKRYIARALGQTNVDQPHIALIRIVERRFTGNIVKWVEPKTQITRSRIPACPAAQRRNVCYYHK